MASSFLTHSASAQNDILPDGDNVWKPIDPVLNLVTYQLVEFANIHVATTSSQSIEWGSFNLVTYSFIIQLADVTNLGLSLPSGEGEGWGISWRIPLPDGQSEEGSIVVSGGKNVVLSQSLSGDSENVQLSNYQLESADCSLTDISEEDGMPDKFWSLQPAISCITG